MSSEDKAMKQPNAAAAPATSEPQPKDSEEAPPDLSPDIRVVISLFIGLITILLTYIYYRVDLRDHGPFSTFVNDKILGGNPWAQKVLLGGGGGEAWRNEL